VIQGPSELVRRLNELDPSYQDSGSDRRAIRRTPWAGVSIGSNATYIKLREKNHDERSEQEKKQQEKAGQDAKREKASEERKRGKERITWNNHAIIAKFVILWRLH
jgi:hypothetical protein